MGRTWVEHNGDGELTEKEKEGDRHPPHVRSPNFLAVVAPIPTTAKHRANALSFLRCPVWARGRCRLSPPSFLAECCKRQLNQGSFVLLYFRSFTFSDLY